MPDLVSELRKEIEEALAANRGVLTSNTLQSMKKMDSFLKETLRLHPASMGNCLLPQPLHVYIPTNHPTSFLPAQGPPAFHPLQWPNHPRRCVGRGTRRGRQLGPGRVPGGG